MPESAEEVYARVVAAGQATPNALQPPADEAARFGEEGGEPCRACAEIVDPDRIVWEDEHWVLIHQCAPSGLPIVLILNSREHEDFGELDDDMASEMGRITNRLVRIIEHLPNIGRAHVNRWGEGGAHAHLWFVARTARLTDVRGAHANDWDEIIPPGPEDIWRADLHAVATKLANWGGEARA
jgi:diadenosine tetraphosphate (Ap4A) HIT family hydrolase